MTIDFVAQQNNNDCYYWRKGNESFSNMDYAKSIEYFTLAKETMPQLSDLIDSNIRLARIRQSKIYTNRFTINIETVDIIVPVYNALEDVKKCLESLEKYTDDFNVHIFVINDASKEETSTWLREYCKDNPLFTLIENSQNFGYTKSVNIGLRASTADYVITQNSDTIVTEGWLKGMICCMKSDPKIGIVGPLSNAGGWQSIPVVKDHMQGGFAVNELPDGFTLTEMAKSVSSISRKIYPSIPLINGFCFMIKRAVINTIGYMDEENFPIGYGEENDYCIRAANAGFDMAVADDVYVWHSKSKSFGDDQRVELSNNGKKTNKIKHTETKYSIVCSSCNGNNELDKLRNKITHEILNSKINFENKHYKQDTVKLLVHLHLFYHDQLDYFLDKLKNITCDYDLFVTVIEVNKESEQKILEFNEKSHIILVNNIGYDIYPFWQILQKINLEDYDYVMKLHTKNFRDNAWTYKGIEYAGYKWRNFLVEPLLDSKLHFNYILKIFGQENNIGMVASKNLIRNYEHHSQLKNTETLCEKIGIKYNAHAEFVCGTMFVIRANLLKELKKYLFIDSNFADKMQTTMSGSIAHSIETIFGILVREKENTIIGIHSFETVQELNHVQNECLTVKHEKNDIIIPVDDSDYVAIKNSSLFDSTYYLEQYKSNRNKIANPASHYQLIGWKEGKNPSKNFDSDKYLDRHHDVKKENINPLVHYERHGKKEGRAFFEVLNIPLDIIQLCGIKKLQYREIFLNYPKITKSNFLSLINKNIEDFSVLQFFNDISTYNEQANITEIWFDNMCGGGTEYYSLQYFKENSNILFVRIQNHLSSIFTISYFYRGLNNKILIESFENIAFFIKFLNCNKIVLNSVVRYENVNEVINALMLYKEYNKVDFIVNLHDFLSICPNVNMLNEEYKFCEISCLTSCYKCYYNIKTPFVKIDSVENWHLSWNKLYQCIDKAVAFSQSTKDIYESLYPVLKNKIIVSPHKVNFIRKVNICHHKNLNIGVLGNIAKHKGALILKDIDIIMEKYNNLNIKIIGNSNLKYKNIKKLGEYSQCELPNIIEKEEIDVIFIPSVWPETFSYTTAESMLMGLPVACFDFGAPSERLQQYGKGIVIQECNAELALKAIIDFMNAYDDKRYQKLCVEKKDFLVHLHLHYHNQIDYFLDKMESILEYDSDIYITLTVDNEKIRKKILQKIPKAKLLLVPNIGYDIAPFIKIINEVDLLDYKYIVKLHTKNFRKEVYANHHLVNKGFEWRNALVDAIMCDKKRIKLNIDLFENNYDIGMIGNNKLLSKSFAKSNAENRQYLCSLLKIENKVYPYIAGTMFMCRANLLSPIKRLELSSESFTCSRFTGDSGSLAHALEDVIGQIIWEQNFKVCGVKISDKLKRIPSNYKLSKKECTVFFVKRSLILIDEQPLSRFIKIRNNIVFFLFIPIGKVISRKVKSVYDTLKDSELFNTYEYQKMYPDVQFSGMNPIDHYINVGAELGYNPSYRFNTREYLRNNPDVLNAKVNPLVHYEDYGKYEKRLIFKNTGISNIDDVEIIKKSKYFSGRWYLKKYPETQLSGLCSASHYLTYGAKENKDPSNYFSTEDYLTLTGDVSKKGINPLVHYEKYGKFENRQPIIRGIYKKIIFFLLNLSEKFNLSNRNFIIMGDLFFNKSVAPIDNFAFFEYLHSKKSKYVGYYILHKNYKEYDFIKSKYGKYIITYRNKADLLFYLKIAFLSFKTRFVLDSFDAFALFFGLFFKKSKKIDIIFSQHGITYFKQEFITPCMYGAKKLDKVIVSNNYEYEIFKTKAGYLEKNIIKLGLFRWDSLKPVQSDSKIIFVYFTFRHYLVKHNNIFETNYFKNIFSLLSNQKLLYMMEKHNIKIKLSLHHDFLSYIELSKFDNFEFVQEEEIKSIKNEAAMLITDFSSMSFDFMLQDKPVIFYRLDENDFWSSKLDSGYASTIKELSSTIYNIYDNEESVVEKIIEYSTNNFELEDIYKDKNKYFFYSKKGICEKFYKKLVLLDSDKS